MALVCARQACDDTTIVFIFFFNDTATTEIYTLSLHDALPIWTAAKPRSSLENLTRHLPSDDRPSRREAIMNRSEEHTSELQSRQYLVCRLLLEKKKKYATVPALSRNRTEQDGRR